VNIQPPRRAEWLLQRLLDAESREAVAGDLEEEYRRVRDARGAAYATLWYAVLAARSVIACRITGRRRGAERRLDFDPSPSLSVRDRLRPALRQFRDYPFYALTCVLTLALAIGAASAGLAVVKRAFFDPLPYAGDDALVSLLTLVDGRTSAVSPHVLIDLQGANPPISGFASIRPAGVAYASVDSTETARANFVSADYFKVLGTPPTRGRVWLTNEPDAVVISSGFWQRALAGDPNVIGRRITLDGTARTIVGVMPAQFVPPYFTGNDVWLPLDMAGLLQDVRGRRTLTILARRADGATQAELESFLTFFSTRLQQQYPREHGHQTWVAPRLRDELIGPARPALIATAAGAFLLLLIVAGNIAGLATAQAVATRRHMAVRAALGATRWRLMVEQFVDSVVLAAVGSAAGVGLAHVLVALAGRYQSHFLERLAPVSLDLSIALTAAASGLAIGILAALVPHRIVNAACPIDSLRARSVAGDRSATTLRTALVGVQVALALVLIVGAGLLVRTVTHLSAVSLGFRSEALSTVAVGLPVARYAEQAAQLQLERDVLARLQQIHGVTTATASVGFPIIGGMGAALAIQGRPTDNGLHEIAYFSIAPNFFSAVEAQIVAGRDLAPSDDANAPRVVVINETMARTFWPEGNAIGARVQIGAGSPTERWITIIGIVADLRQHGPTEMVRPTAFGSTYQYSWPRRHFTVRTDKARSMMLATELRAAIRAADSGIPIVAVTPVEQMITDRTARHTLVMLALVLFGSVALLLCLAGLYAVVALSSRLRRREYAIRMALGAARGRVRWLVVRQALVVAGAGTFAGILAASAATRALDGLLHGVRPLDGVTFAASAGALLALATIAAWYPAREAERVDPVEALQAE